MYSWFCHRSWAALHCQLLLYGPWKRTPIGATSPAGAAGAVAASPGVGIASMGAAEADPIPAPIREANATAEIAAILIRFFMPPTLSESTTNSNRSHQKHISNFLLFYCSIVISF
jgi:hypothetical protein